MLTGFNHTGLVVRDLGAMIDFYTQVLGLKIAKKIASHAPPTGDHTGFPNARRELVFLDLGSGHQLELVYYETPASPTGAACDRHQLGSLHICFFVDDLHATWQTLCEQGVKFLTEPKFSTNVSGERTGVVYLQDPEGNWLELVERGA